MPLPSGKWDIVSGGQVGELTFSTFTGSVSGTIFTDNFVGFFDEASQTLSLLRNPQVITQGGFSGVVATPLTIYQGSLFQFTSGTTQFSVLTGVFFTDSGANTAPSYVTWYAQHPPPVKISKEGKDGKDGKDHKDKDQKDHKDKEPPDFPPVFSASAPFPFEPPPGAQSVQPGAAIGRSFIDDAERPSVGESALQDPRLGGDADS
jgi:hypothetical protein